MKLNFLCRSRRACLELQHALYHDHMYSLMHFSVAHSTEFIDCSNFDVTLTLEEASPHNVAQLMDKKECWQPAARILCPNKLIEQEQ